MGPGPAEWLALLLSFTRARNATRPKRGTVRHGAALSGTVWQAVATHRTLEMSSNNNDVFGVFDDLPLSRAVGSKVRPAEGRRTFDFRHERLSGGNLVN